MKSVILPFAMIRPLMTPIAAPAGERHQHGQPQPGPCGRRLSRSTTAPNVIVEATDRSMPAGGDHECLADRQDDEDRGRDQHRLDVAAATGMSG